jgi:ketosteroid isomerase-like protein
MSQENAEITRGVRIPLSPLSEKASQRRALDERLFVRVPALYRLLADRITRLPPGSRLRRLMLTRLVVRGYAANNRRDFDVLLTGLDPEIEYRPAPNLITPDEDRVTHGHDGYLRRLRNWRDAFDDLRFDLEEVIDFGDKLLVTVRWSGRGSGSGVPMSGRLFQLFTQRRGFVQKQEDFADRNEALEAAGLRE